MSSLTQFMPVAFESIIVSIAALVFGLLLAVTAPRIRTRELTVHHLALYALMGLFSNIALLIGLLQVANIPVIAFTLATQFGLLALILTFGALTLTFVKQSQRVLISYWGVGLVLLLLWGLFAFDVQGIGQAALSVIAGMVDSVGQLITLVAALGWVVGILTALIALSLAFRKRQLTQYLNKLRYWLTATALLTVSGLVLYISPALFGSAGVLLLIVGSLLVGYAVLSYQTADLKLLVGRALYFAGVTAVLTAVFAAVMAVDIIISRHNPTSNEFYVLFWTIALAIVVAVIFPWLWRFSNRLLSVIVFGKNYRDTQQVVRHYSQNISSALDLNRLGTIVINLMIETLGIEQGIVFVRERADVEGFSLRPLASVGCGELATGRFAPDSPFILYFNAGGKILPQYDIDMLPKFRPIPLEERQWLTGLGIELFVPIMLQHELIGLLAFGPQSQGTSYYEEDLELMTALADRVAPAIDNARLFEQLALINQEVGQLTERLVGLDQNKTDFLSIASHELRTPLTHIHGYSRMLLDLTEEELKDPAYVKTIIQGVAKGSERMKDVVDMMFDVTEAGIGEMNLFLGPVLLEEVIDQASRPFLPAIDQRRIAFGMSNVKDLPPLEADGTRLVQAFEHLIGNAVKFTPDGGMVTIHGSTVDREDLGMCIQIEVADSGIGIDPQYHERIFEKFFRIDDTLHHSTGKTKFKGAGPGLGLTLVKGIVEAHGGKIWVESLGYDEVNCPGSKFIFVIPLVRAVPKEMPRQADIETRHWRR